MDFPPIEVSGESRPLQRESAPDIRVSLRSTSLAPALLRGSARRAILGPTCLVWHPAKRPSTQHLRSVSCRDSGTALFARLWMTERKAKTEASWPRPLQQSQSPLAVRPNPSIRARTTPLSAGRAESLRSGLSGRMPRELCWAMDGPSQRAHGAMME
jgi:hypothetical protein